MIGFKEFCLGLLMTVGLLSGCASTYQPMVFMDKKLDVGFVSAAAKSSNDIFDFVGKIYNKHHRYGGREQISEFEITYNDYDKIWDTFIYKKYCDAKMGQIYRLYSGSDVRYYICETNSQVESVLGYYKYHKENPYPGQRYYSFQYMTPKFFNDNMKYRNAEYYFANEDKSLRLEPIADSNVKKYNLTLNIKNMSSSPDFFALNNARIINEGKEYIVSLNNFKNGVTLNPGQTYKSYSEMSVNGLNDLVSSNIVLIFGDKRFVLKQRMYIDDKEPFAIEVDKNKIL